MSNYFVSYDLIAPNKNYDAVIGAIKSFGKWAHVQKSLWYISTNHDAKHIAEYIRTLMDADDTLIVIKAEDAYWFGMGKQASDYIQQQWHL